MKIKNQLKKLERSKKAMLSLVHNGTWSKDDKFFLQMYNENKEAIQALLNK